jgi:uncharacterized Zn finger protein
MASALENVVTRDALLDLAGERYFERGEDYHRGGHVHDLVEHDGVVVAKVAGTEDYRVRLWPEDGFAFSCDCPLGLVGEFCKHCVAAGLAWLEGDFSVHAPGGSATMDDVQTYLEEQDRAVLVRIVMEQAMEDERLRERLLLRASRMGGLDLAAFRRAVDDAVYFDDYSDSPWDHARGIQNVVRAITELLEEGFAAEEVELSEYVLAKIESIRDYAVDGTIYSILEDLHHEACKRSAPDPEALAKRHFEWELGGDHDTFFDAVNTYTDVLGNKGLAEYRRLAKKEWADVPALGPNPENRPHYYGKRERLAEIMQTLAYRSGDAEALVAVKSKDLSTALSYLEIARIYRQQGDDEKALEWAEEGAWVFPGGGHPDLRRFLADEYHDRGRHEEAMNLIWTEFAEEHRLDGYEELKAHADRTGTWEHWRHSARIGTRRYRQEEGGVESVLYVVSGGPLGAGGDTALGRERRGCMARGKVGRLLRKAMARARRPARSISSRRLPHHLPGEDRTSRKPYEQQSLREGLRSDTEGAYPDVSPGPPGRVPRVRGAAPPGVQTQAELHEAARQD